MSWTYTQIGGNKKVARNFGEEILIQSDNLYTKNETGIYHKGLVT
jgi:hypothetical protein